MTFPHSSKLAAAVSKVSGDNSNEKASLKSKVSMAPVILTEIDKKHSGLATTSLHDMFHVDHSTNTFRTCFYVTRVEPGNVCEAVKKLQQIKQKNLIHQEWLW
jgi:hypothetical protein